MKKIILTTLALSILVCGCTKEYKPTREPYEGFKWKKFSGAGLTLWVQENENIKFTSNTNTIFIEKKNPNGESTFQPVIKVFQSRTPNLNEFKLFLEKTTTQKPKYSWDEIKNCEFRKRDYNKQIIRYTLMPKGKVLAEMMLKGRTEPIPQTCGGYGVGNSGFRYFEIDKNIPYRIIFVEIGQEAPLFDETSIK